MKEPVSRVAAWKLANHFGICASDGLEQARWLRVLANDGDAAAMTELAIVLRYIPGGLAEADRWRDLAAKAARPHSPSSGVEGAKPRPSSEDPR